MFSYKSLKIGIRTMGVSIGILGMCQVHAADTIPVSEANYAEAETARNFVTGSVWAPIKTSFIFETCPLVAKKRPRCK